MIRALRACLRRPDLRRLVGVVALLAFVLVVVLGAAHAGETGDPEHDHCGVCVAATAVLAGETLSAPELVERLGSQCGIPPGDAEVPVASEPRRSHAPRGPPVVV